MTETEGEHTIDSNPIAIKPAFETMKYRIHLDSDQKLPEILWREKKLHVCGECRDCKHYEWDGQAGSYGACQAWISLNGHLLSQLAVGYTPMHDEFCPPGPSYGCTQWKGKE